MSEQSVTARTNENPGEGERGDVLGGRGVRGTGKARGTEGGGGGGEQRNYRPGPKTGGR